jgi:hypothetical protein|tara:strand:+ start:451 stop:669 length:219 start_codon:yes stop_codon:yes gene_type:complete
MNTLELINLTKAKIKDLESSKAPGISDFILDAQIRKQQLKLVDLLQLRIKELDAAESSVLSAMAFVKNNIPR